MNCLICKTGEMVKGHTTVVLERDDSTVIFKQVPATVCQNCGEYILDETVSNKVFQSAESAVERGAEVEILKYAA